MQATERIVPILVDCTSSGAHRTYLETYKVRGFPTLLFVGADGESLGPVEKRDAATLLEHIDRYSQGPGGRSLLPVAAVVLVIAVAVAGALVLVYKKWLVSPEEDP